MKIAILTLPFNLNYGGIIQNYALQTVLKRMGHEVYTININWPKPKMSLNKAPFSISKRLIKKLIGRKNVIIFWERKYNNEKPIIEQYVREFINRNINLTQPYYTKKDLSGFDKENFDVVIVGSDQVWREPYAYPDIETYFLDFIKNKQTKKLAYSASFGTDEIEFSDKQIKKCGELIKEFEIITVREDTGLNLINTIYQWSCKNTPVHTLDPTMLLSKEDYTHISSKYENQLNGDLFYYVIDMTEDKRKVLEQISRDLGFKPFTVMNKSNNWADDLKDRIAPPLELWLQAFKQAKYVFTDSFHGSVFSIIFNKEFIVYGNKERGMSRFNSLLNMFQLKNRFISNSDEYNSQLITQHINWNNVNKILKEEKKKSLIYLSKISPSKDFISALH